MGDFAVSDSAFSFEDVRAVSPTDSGIPPVVLARWAALASARACFGVIPRQAELKA
jgi:hypothetical protein